MRKIRLSDTDLELFDMEVSPSEFSYFQKHKDAFRCMWKEQGKPFWTRFTITFRSFTVKHGVIKQMNCDSPKFENLLDHGFIYIHEKFIDGKEGSARIFIEDIARLAQNHDKFSNLDSKSFSKDPFYLRETRDLFRRFFGQPDQKASYLKVYVLSPIYLRFGGSVCRCLKKWMDAEVMDSNDESYWLPPAPSSLKQESKCTKVVMCEKCLDDCGTKYFHEKICGEPGGPKYLEYWRLGDPRFNDNKNPLYCQTADKNTDWRENLSVEDFRDFLHYAKFKYGSDDDKCKECLSLCNNKDAFLHLKCGPECHAEKKKKKKKKKRKDATKDEDSACTDAHKITHHYTSTTVVESVTYETSNLSNNGSRATDDEKARKTKTIFSSKAKVTDDFKYGIMSGSNDENKRKVVGGFKVVKIEDEKTKAYEMTITVAALKGEDDTKSKEPKDPTGNYDKYLPLTVEQIHNAIENLPQKMEWWEAIGWCACVLNYEVEEKHLCKNPTNFTIKVSGPDEDSVKRTMFKLLFYVSKRKKRPCPGWTMNDDDIVACILPDDSPDQEGLTISITKGFRFEERLSDAERKALQLHKEANEAPAKKVLMTLDGKDCAAMLQEVPMEGKVNLKKLLQQISNGALNDDTEEEYVALEDGSVLRTGRGEPPVIDVSKSGQPVPESFSDMMDGLNLTEEPIWEQMQKNPDNFDLYVMVDKDKEAEMKEHGLKTVNMEYIRELESNEKCQGCSHKKMDCKCDEGFKIPKPSDSVDMKSVAKNIHEFLVPDPSACDVDVGEVDTAVFKEWERTRGIEFNLVGATPTQNVPVGESTWKSKTKEGEKLKALPVETSKTTSVGTDKTTQTKPLKTQTKETLTTDSSETSKISTGEGGQRQTANGMAKEESTTCKETDQAVPTDVLKQNDKSVKTRTKELTTTDKVKHEGKKEFPKDKDSSLSGSILINGPSKHTSKEKKMENVSNNASRNKQDGGKEKAERKEGHNKNSNKAGNKGETKQQKELEDKKEVKKAENGSLRNCANCGQKEPAPKTYKKCQKCKLENIVNARYYCGRDCQVADWTNKHKKEHKENQLD